MFHVSTHIPFPKVNSPRESTARSLREDELSEVYDLKQQVTRLETQVTKQSNLLATLTKQILLQSNHN